jgi:hypothetical protein
MVRPGPYGLQWWVHGLPAVQTFGLNTDIPVPRDYFGDGNVYPATVRPGSGSLTWYLYDEESNDYVAFLWGLSSDKLVPADYDGDGKAEAAVFRPSNGTWYILRVSDMSPTYVTWGLSTDIPVPGDYDGDNKFDVAVFRPSTATWYILYSAGGQCTRQFGDSTDTPVPALYIP